MAANEHLTATHDDLVKSLEALTAHLKAGGMLQSDYKAARLALYDAAGMAFQLDRQQFDAECAAIAEQCRADARALKAS